MIVAAKHFHKTLKGSEKGFWKVSEYASGSEYVRVVNIYIPGFWIRQLYTGSEYAWMSLNNSWICLIISECIGLWICQGSVYTRVLNMLGFYRILGKLSIVNVSQGSEYPSSSECAGVLNLLGIWICYVYTSFYIKRSIADEGSGYASRSESTKTLYC